MIKNYLLTLLFLTTLLPSSWGQSRLTQHLDSLINLKLPEGADIGVSVYDLTDKKQLYSYRENKLSRPASTMKLLTVITALETLSPQEVFRTEVWCKGIVRQDTLIGDLYVIGGFDPEFDDAAMDSLVDKVKSSPFSVIQGKIYGDLSMKDSLYWGTGWLWDDTPSAYQPYMSPLMLNKGMVTVTALPAATKGDSAIILCEPMSGFYTLTNQAKSKDYNVGKFSVSRNWLEDKNDIIVKGNVTGRRKEGVNMYPSQDFFMYTFTERLRQKGLKIPDEYDYAELEKDSLSFSLASWDTPLQKVVNEVMKESDNLGAEALLCKIAVNASQQKKVSWDDGLNVVKAMVQRAGHDPKKYKIADGCGLSQYNYISPQLLVDLLKYAYNSSTIFGRLYKSLPIAGIDGTLQYRMKTGTKTHKNVHAKTGTFTGVSSLAGYLKSAGGHDIAFAIMNQNQLAARDVRALQDLICEELCGLY